MAKKDNNIFALALAGIGALVAALVGVNELSKSRSGNNNFSSAPKKSGCGCNGP